MPLSGGPADKAGNTYELKWLVRQFLRVLSGDINWVHLEPPGKDGEKVEFILEALDGSIEAHQVKRQKGTAGVWTVSDLNTRGVLAAIEKHTIQAGRNFRFVSVDGVKSLRELADRSRDTVDIDEFEREFLPDGATGDFDRLCVDLGGVSRSEGFEILQKCRFDAISDGHLSDELNALMGFYVDGDNSLAVDALASWGSEQTHRKISASEIWQQLTSKGFHARDLAKDTTLVGRIQSATDEFLSSQAFDIGGRTFQRDEAVEATGPLTDGSKHTVIVHGKAGIGKTGVIAQIAKAQHSNGWTVLAFRMDRLDPTTRLIELGKQLFGRECSPVAALAAVSGEGDSLLVIEQLDAISTTSGRNAEFFHVVDQMIREAIFHPRMRVMVGCRTFDLNNDRRIRELSQRDKSRTVQVPVRELNDSVLAKVLDHLGIDETKLNDRQRQMYRTPLHLYLLNSVLKNIEEKFSKIVNPDQLYDEFWDAKRTETALKLGNPNNFEIVLYRLAEEMTRSQELSVPKSVVRDLNDDAQRLISANVLNESAYRISFFHEGYFDYVYARFFCEGGGSLFNFISSGTQDLFIRSQVRQILTYIRERNFDEYMGEIRNCIEGDRIRFHVKSLIVEVIGLVQQPTVVEWEILSNCLNSSSPGIANSARSALWSSIAWFRFLSSSGTLQEWLSNSNDELQNFTFNYCRGMADDVPELVATILSEFAGLSIDIDNKILGAIVWSKSIGECPEIENLFLSIVTAQDRDWAFRRSAIDDSLLYSSRKGPKFACKILGVYLTMMAKEPGEVSAFFDNSGSSDRGFSDHSLRELEEKSPLEFANEVTKPLVKLFEKSVVLQDGEAPPYRTEVWNGGFRGLRHHTPEVLLSCLANALKKTADDDLLRYLELIDILAASECRPAQAVVLRALCIPVENVKRHGINLIRNSYEQWGGWHDEFALWDLRRLFEVWAPLVKRQEIEGLEPHIFKHIEQWSFHEYEDESSDQREERIRNYARWHRESYGRAQHQILSFIPNDCLSPTAIRKKQELHRKFGPPIGEAPYDIRGGTVVSPLQSVDVSLLTDDQWLSAMRRYADKGELIWLSDGLIGGARELSMQMAECAKGDPERFARLLLRFPLDSNEDYFAQIAIALTNQKLPLGLVTDVVECLHSRPGRPHGRWVPRIIDSIYNDDIDDSLLNIVSWYALQSTDPECDVWREEASGGTRYYSGDPYSHGINTVRGSAALSISTLVGADKKYWFFFEPTIELLVQDHTISVRTCAVNILTQVLRYDRPRAIELFHHLCDADDVLLGADSVERFVNYTAINDWPALVPMIERMHKSSDDDARQNGARQGTLAALFVEDAKHLSDVALAGDKSMRVGAAQVFSHNILRAHDQKYCEGILIDLLNDDDKEVRQAADDWLRRIDDLDHLGKLVPLTESYIDSKAFKDSPDALFRVLEKVVDAPSSLLFEAGHRFLENAGREAGDVRTHSAFASHNLSDLVIRAYSQSEDSLELRSKCLDLFDHMIQSQAYGAGETLNKFERT